MSKLVRLFLATALSLCANENTFGQRRGATPPELKGSKLQRVEQNQRAESLGIKQIANEEELQNLIKSDAIVELTDDKHYFIDKGAETKPRKITRRVKGKRIVINCEPKPNKIFVYPWVKEYLDKRSADYFTEFRKKFKFTSAARSLKEQILMRTKGSCYYTPFAALADNPLEETLHARAIAVDISRKGMKAKEIKWIRERLLADKILGVEFEIDPTEETICYHIVVFPREPQKH